MAGSMGGALKYLGESVPVCTLELQFPALQRKDESIHFGISAPSEGIHSTYQAHTQIIPAKKNITSSGHHVMMSDVI